MQCSAGSGSLRDGGVSVQALIAAHHSVSTTQRSALIGGEFIVIYFDLPCFGFRRPSCVANVVVSSK